MSKNTIEETAELIIEQVEPEAPAGESGKPEETAKTEAPGDTENTPEPEMPAPIEEIPEPEPAAAWSPVPPVTEAGEPETFPEEEDGQTEKRRIPRILLILLPVIAAVIIAAAVYTHLSEQYRTVFFNNTRINGVDVSGMTAEEADHAVSAKGEDYNLEIIFRDGSTSTITGEQMDYGYHAYEAIASILAGQEPMGWLMENNKDHDYTVELIPDYNPTMLNAATAALPQFQPSNMTAPTDARVTIENNRLVVVPETQGNLFDADACAAAIAEAVSRFEPTLDVSVLDIYAKPQITADQAAQASHVEELNHLLSAAITLELPEQPVLLDGSVTVTWLSTDEQGNFYRDEELWNQRVREYTESVAAIVSNAPNVRQFDTTGLGTITIEGGTYRSQVNVDAEAAALSQLLLEGAVVSRTPVMQTASGSTENHGLGNTYVEIDLSRQILWAYDHGELWMETPIVSGRMTEDRYTPGGVYYVYYKQRDRILRGDALGYASDGTPIYGYASPVSYWMPFNGGIGMHDADWRGAFGGSIYITDGSHGCINMPVDQAPLMYNWITSEIPIVVYYSEPYELAPATGDTEVISAADDSGEEEYVTPDVTAQPAEYTEPAPEPETADYTDYTDTADYTDPGTVPEYTDEAPAAEYTGEAETP